MRILANDTMAILIDVQEKLLPAMYNQEEVLHNIEILLKGLETIGIPVIITQQYTKGLGQTVPILQECIGEEFTFYEKLSFSCIDNDTILSELTKQKKRNVIIFGIESHICVLQTVIDCMENGYQAIVVEDCISSRKFKDKEIARLRMIKEGAIITTYESILFELTRMAGNDKFKTISKLIK